MVDVSTPDHANFETSVPPDIPAVAGLFRAINIADEARKAQTAAMPITFIPFLAVFVASGVAWVRKTQPVRSARIALWAAISPAAFIEIFVACFFATGLMRQTRAYMGADMAFGIGTIISVIWVAIILAGYAVGRMWSGNGSSRS